jgi:predicted methyltransferase
MNTNRPLLALVLALSAAGSAASAPARAVPADVTSAVAASTRPADAIKLDDSRKPAPVLAFMGLRRGDRALDLFTGSGYFAEIMGRAVGPTGSVTAWEPANFVNAKARTEYTELHARVPNVGIVTTPATALALPTATFDFVMIDLNYHDTYWQSDRFHFPRMDPAAFLRTVYDSMKPGGVMAVIDHVANPGGDTRAVVDKLHRIDPATVKADFERAGFVLEAQSDLLRNPADDHSKLVFDPAIRGKTDRIVWRFRKPRH